MSYYPSPVPEQYDPDWMANELARLARQIGGELPLLFIAPQGTAPQKPRDGMIANADGTNWNPGSGAGLYEYVGGSWSKL